MSYRKEHHKYGHDIKRRKIIFDVISFQKKVYRNIAPGDVNWNQSNRLSCLLKRHILNRMLLNRFVQM